MNNYIIQLNYLATFLWLLIYLLLTPFFSKPVIHGEIRRKSGSRAKGTSSQGVSHLEKVPLLTTQADEDLLRLLATAFIFGWTWQVVRKGKHWVREFLESFRGWFRSGTGQHQCGPFFRVAFHFNYIHVMYILRLSKLWGNAEKF